MSTSRRSGIALMVLVVVASLAPTASVAADASRATVIAAYQTQLEPLLMVPTGSTADVARCFAGATSKENQAATLGAVNYLRKLAGLKPVTMNPALSKKSQAAALIMSANSMLTHFPSSNLRCYTKAGYEGASHGNLYLGGGLDPQKLDGATGARAAVGYFTDDGDNNTSVGHRRWLLWQGLREIGSGDAQNANSIYVVPSKASRALGTAWVSWPTAGFFPRELEPQGRWSLSYPRATFESARVRMTGPDGRSLRVKRYSPTRGYGDNTLVWEVQLPDAYYIDSEADITINVEVTGIRLSSGARVTKRWSTTFVKAAATPGWEAANHTDESLPLPLLPGWRSFNSYSFGDDVHVSVSYWNGLPNVAVCAAAQQRFYQARGWVFTPQPNDDGWLVFTGSQAAQTMTLRVKSYQVRTCEVEISVSTG